MMRIRSLYIHISRSSINASRAPSNWSRDAFVSFLLRRWVVVREVQKLIYPHFSKREKKHRTRRINTITSNKNKNKNIKRTRKDKRKGYGA